MSNWYFRFSIFETKFSLHSINFLSLIVQSLSRVWLCMTPWTTALQASLSFTVSQSLLKFMFIELMTPSRHLMLCHPLLLLPSIFACIRVLSNESVLHIRCPKYWSFSFRISLSSGYSGLISFRIDWLGIQRLRSWELNHSLALKGKREGKKVFLSKNHKNCSRKQMVGKTRP